MNTISLKPKVRCHDNPRLFLLSLQESNLLSQEQFADVQQHLNVRDVTSVAAQLVRKGWLNTYQLLRIFDGEARGLVLGQYRIVAELGEGGFGTVYRAVHALMDRPAAVKVISPKWAQSADGRKLFLREVVAATRLVHPNIALVYEANQTGDALWFAMEYVGGPTLDQYVASRGPLSVPFACALVHQVARALQCAHENGMVHRDVKPANLLLPGADLPSVDGGLVFPEVMVKVVDFGLARLLAPDAAGGFSLCADGMCVGTPEYMSPEQARNSHEVDIRSDLYSLGCVFFFALAGRPPFRGETEMETVAQHMTQRPERLAQLRPDVPSAVAAVVDRLLAKDPENRFATPADLIEALCSALGTARPAPLSLPTAVPTSADAAEVPPDEKKRSRSPAIRHPTAALWGEWLGVVGALAGGEAPGWAEGEYKLLYESLLSDLRAGPAAYGELASLAEPWVTLRALTGLDKKTLAALWRTGRRLGAERFPARRLPLAVWAGILSLLGGLVAVLARLLLGGR